MVRHPQIEMRKRTASPRRLVLRLVMFDLSSGFFTKRSDSFEDAASQAAKANTRHTFELPLNEEMQETTGGATLDAASIHAFRSMFLLLDEWDRTWQSRQKEDSSGEALKFD